jgi:hypothetical protein
MSMILLEPAYKILHTFCEVQAADHLSSRLFGNFGGEVLKTLCLGDLCETFVLTTNMRRNFHRIRTFTFIEK